MGADINAASIAKGSGASEAASVRGDLTAWSLLEHVSWGAGRGIVESGSPSNDAGDGMRFGFSYRGGERFGHLTTGCRRRRAGWEVLGRRVGRSPTAPEPER